VKTYNCFVGTSNLDGISVKLLIGSNEDFQNSFPLGPNILIEKSFPIIKINPLSSFDLTRVVQFKDFRQFSKYFYYFSRSINGVLVSTLLKISSFEIPPQK